MGLDTVTHVLASNVADAATFDVAYPANKDAGAYLYGVNHLIQSDKYGTLKHGDKVSFSFGATAVTITNNTGTTLEAGTQFYVQYDQPGGNLEVGLASLERMSRQTVVMLSLGAPDTIDPDGIAASQNLGAAGDMLINGALATGGVATLDVPRNVVVDSGGADTAVLTVYGTDEFGAVLRESITLNGTTAVSGKKAFKTITRIAASAAIANGAFVGPGDVLGLPVFLGRAGRVLKEMEDGAAATAGTIVAGVRTKATATTGDVRGTYDPNSAADGAKVFSLIVAVDNPGDRGVAQYNG